MSANRTILQLVAVAALSAMCTAQSMGQHGSANKGMDQDQSTQQQPGAMGAPMPDTMGATSKSPDQAFIMKAAEGGMAEVQMGNIAKQNAGNDSVKKFGDQMVTDHSKANGELQQLAQKKGISLPSSPSGKDKKMSKTLESKKGAEFDKAYMHDMVNDHEKDVAEFRKEAQSGKDPEVKAWAQKTLPVLEQHLTTAKQVAGQVGAESGSKKAGAMASDQH